MWPVITILLACFAQFTSAQEGILSGPATSKAAAAYSCDASICKLPDCNCASTVPPGGLNPVDVPQFIVFTADDGLSTYTLDAVNQFLAHRKNPNGCSAKMTYFVSNQYTDYSLVTEWYVTGNEIADHTMTHVGSPPVDEINGNIIAFNALSGIPMAALKGFRAPFLDFSVDTLKHLYASAFLYDSSATASIPVTHPETDAFWPYTLDYGLANNCLQVPGLCKGEPKLPGFWEIPMYAFFDQRDTNGPHLMDPWLDKANGAASSSDDATLAYMKKTFSDHYANNRQPIGLYTHPIHLSTTYPGVNTNKSTIDMINSFLDWAQQQPNVWIVSNEQLLAWVRHPIPAAQMTSLPSFQCAEREVASASKICNGIPGMQDGLLERCAFPDSPFSTCYGCPSELPTPANPNPKKAATEETRHQLPADCSTQYWDPVNGKCTCASSACAFLDISRPVGPNGANITGGIISTAASNGQSSNAASNSVKSSSTQTSIPPLVLVLLLVTFIGSHGL